MNLQVMCSVGEMWNIGLLQSVLILPELCSVCVINAGVEHRLCAGIGGTEEEVQQHLQIDSANCSSKEMTSAVIADEYFHICFLPEIY